MATFHVPGTSFQFAEREQGGTPSPRTMEHDSPPLLVVAGLWLAPAATRLSGWPAPKREGRRIWAVRLRGDRDGERGTREEAGIRARHQGRTSVSGPFSFSACAHDRSGEEAGPRERSGEDAGANLWAREKRSDAPCHVDGGGQQKTELAIWPGVLGAGMGFRVN
jgi:hypothetical protein